MPSDPSVESAVQSGLLAQLQDLTPTLDNLAEIAGLLADLQYLASLLVPNPPPLAALGDSTNGIIGDVTSIAAGQKPGSPGTPSSLPDFGPVLVDLLTFQQTVAVWLPSQAKILPATQTQILALLASCVTQIQELLSYRPDVGAVVDDLAQMQGLQGGPADATAFHDFNVLQLAFRSVWMHSFDQNLKNAAAQLYDQANALYAEAGQPLPDLGDIDDISQLRDFVSALADTTGIVIDTNGQSAAGLNSPMIPPPTENVAFWYPEGVGVWSLLSSDQRASITSLADQAAEQATVGGPNYFQNEADLKTQVDAIVASPQGTAARLVQLINDISVAQSEPYAFDVFAPDSYNFGLVITYRQIWEPGPYQAGDLVSTIPLAPGETRKYSHRRVVKESVSRRVADKSTRARSEQTSEDSRAEREIMQRATESTNFKMTTKGSFNIGVGSMDVSTEFGGNAATDSTQNKRDFHEATLKSAEEYRQERSMEVDTTSYVEDEDSFTGEISNPNNEITVTYLFYELQRRYNVREYLYRVQPVILIAQDVPSPEQINEAWLIQYQWIISRVLLDDSLRPALNYLSTGYAGDQLSVAALETQWKTQAALVGSLEEIVQKQMALRDSMRDAIINTSEEKDMIPEMPGVLNIFTLGMNPTDGEKNALNAQIKAGESRLKYTEQALSDAQEKLNAAASSFRQATKEYTAALREQFSRQIAIDQLRVNIKQNIYYYMQAIWAHEVSDQRFFRLYNKQVLCPQILKGCAVKVKTGNINVKLNGKAPIEFENTCVPGLGGEFLGGELEDLSAVADLDNPLGYKGNYIIFPMTAECPITDYMLSEYIDSYLGAADPDGADGFDPEEFDDQWNAAVENHDTALQATLKAKLLANIENLNERSDEIIVPTGQLFVEALPGTHTLLEPFKLEHRLLDLAEVRASNRFRELENLRLAARLAADPQVLQDPHIDKRIVVDKNVGVVMDSNP
jgi:hypothetical protein